MTATSKQESSACWPSTHPKHLSVDMPWPRRQASCCHSRPILRWIHPGSNYQLEAALSKKHGPKSPTHKVIHHHFLGSTLRSTEVVLDASNLTLAVLLDCFLNQRQFLPSPPSSKHKEQLDVRACGRSAGQNIAITYTNQQMKSNNGNIGHANARHAQASC